ncbi:hypothetical protein KC799_08230 [candidate division KSB1 bacterium]|nr:hypothetical protein [candidate division KSB1 bacterium]
MKNVLILLCCIFAVANIYSCSETHKVADISFYCMDQYGKPIEGLEVTFWGKNKLSGQDGKLSFTKQITEDVIELVSPVNHEKLGAEFLGPLEIPVKKARPRLQVNLNFYRAYTFSFVTSWRTSARDTNLIAFKDVKIQTRARVVGETNDEGRLDGLTLKAFDPDSITFIAQSPKTPKKNLIIAETIQPKMLEDFAYDHFHYELNFVFTANKRRRPEPLNRDEKYPPPPPKKEAAAPAKITINTGGLLHSLVLDGGPSTAKKEMRQRPAFSVPANQALELVIEIDNREDTVIKFHTAPGGDYTIKYSLNDLVLYQHKNGREEEIERFRVKRK